MTTVLAKLMAQCEETGGYINYVFRNLETEDVYDKYILCTMYPNWDHRIINLEDIGYLTYEVHIAGADKYFDGEKFLPYRYTGIQFIKFIDKPNETSKNIIL